MKDRVLSDIASTLELEDVAKARRWTELLEDRLALELGVPVVDRDAESDARRIAARRTGLQPGTLENLRGGRRKSVTTRIMDRLRGALIRQLETEANRLEHEAQLLRQTGSDPRDGEIEAVLASLAKVRTALGLDGGGK